jgi:tripartite ATP-independent transporter DctM subunit
LDPVFILLGATLLLFLIGIPVSFAFMITAIGGVLLSPDIPIQLIGSKMANATNSYPLLAIPFFILMGEVLNEIKVTDIIFDFANTLVGHIKGGLAHANILACTIFAGMSGSAVAEAAGLGRIMIKAMTERGFGRGFSAAVTAAGSTIGPIIPPSIPLVLYGFLAEVSIGKLLIGGIIPGFIMAALLMLCAYIISARRDYPQSKFPGWRSTATGFITAFPALLSPVILIGGMLGGFFTPTEASAVAVAYTFVLGILYRRVSFKMSWDIFKKTGVDSAALLFILVGATLVGVITVRLHMGDRLVELIAGFTNDVGVVLLLLNILLLIAGCFLDATSILVLFTPLLMPLIKSFGINPVHFGVVMVLNLMIGLLTPPVGLSMFIVRDIAKISTIDFVKEAYPFIFILLVALAIITYFPQTVLWLPTLLLG